MRARSYGAFVDVEVDPGRADEVRFDFGCIIDHTTVPSRMGGLVQFQSPRRRRRLLIIVWTELAYDLGTAFMEARNRRSDRRDR